MDEDFDADLDDNFLELAGGLDEPNKRRVFEQYRQSKADEDGSDAELGRKTPFSLTLL